MLLHVLDATVGYRCSETYRPMRCAEGARSESLCPDVWTCCHCVSALKRLYCSRYCLDNRQGVQEAERRNLRCCCGTAPEWQLRLCRSAEQLQIPLRVAG